MTPQDQGTGAAMSGESQASAPGAHAAIDHGASSLDPADRAVPRNG